MWFVSQHNFIENFRSVVDKGDFVRDYVKLYNLAQVDSRKASDRLQRVKSKIWLLVKAQELEQRYG